MTHIATLDLALPYVTDGTAYPSIWYPGSIPDRPEGTLRVRVELPPDVDLADAANGDGELVVTTAEAVKPAESTPPAGGIFGRPADRDPEVRAMPELREALGELDETTRARVLAWATARYGR